MFMSRSWTIVALTAVVFALGLVPALAHAQVVPGLPDPNAPYGPGGLSPFQPGGLTDPNRPYAPMSHGGYPYFYPIYPYPYYYNPWSGIADIVREQGQFMMNQEMARIIREKAYQEFLKSQKQRVELERWLKATEPTYTDIQRKWAAVRLSRLTEFATPAEINSGRALNEIFGDLKKKDLKAGKIEEPPFLSEEVLRRLNVTVGDTGANLGLLRRSGSISWPLALSEIADEKTRREIEVLAQDLVDQVRTTGKVDRIKLKDLDVHLQKLRKDLDAKALKMQFRRYLQADAFLENMRGVIYALENQEAAVKYFNYLNWIKGGKTVDELVQYMAKEGLRFSNATEGDEAAYEAAYAAFASYDITFHVKTNSGKQKKTPQPDQ
ncbi:MAG TPA: hypothetical protein VNN17_06260 [Terriglobia bacterium]|nr:hypothetical protein [Terriglobia bacterium]